MAIKDTSATAKNDQIGVVAFALSRTVEHKDRGSTFTIRAITFDPLGEARVSFGVA
jgi:hypothetical protein